MEVADGTHVTSRSVKWKLCEQWCQSIIFHNNMVLKISQNIVVLKISQNFLRLRK